MSPYTNVFDIMKRVFLFSKVIGLAPFNLNSTSSWKDCFAVFWSYTLLMSVIIFSGYSLNFQISLQSSLIVEIVEIGEDFLNCFVSIVTLFWMIIHRKNVYDLLQEFSSFDNKMRIKCLTPDFKTTNKKIFNFSVIMVAIVLVTIIVKHVILFYFFGITTITLLFSNIRCGVAFLIYSVIIIQFCVLALSVKQKIEMMNYYLLINFNVKYNSKNATYVSEKLRFASYLHTCLCNMSAKINAIYQVPLVFSIFLQLLLLLTSLFTIIQTIFLSGMRNKTFGVIGQDTVDVIIYFIFVPVLVTISSDTMREARKTGALLHSFMAGNMVEAHQLSVITFSLKLMHNNIYFTGCNLFPIDESLIHSVLATVCSYLVIIIQFELQEMNKKNTNISQKLVG